MNTNEKLLDGLETIIKRINKAIETDDAQFLTGALLHIRATAKGMLALPRRNCDVGTAEEQSERFIWFCFRQKQEKCGVCHRACPCYEASGSCRLIWAQMPYEEVKEWN